MLFVPFSKAGKYPGFLCALISLFFVFPVFRNNFDMSVRTPSQINKGFLYRRWTPVHSNVSVSIFQSLTGKSVRYRTVNNKKGNGLP